MRARGACCGLDLVVAGVGAGVSDVGADRVGEQKSLLEHECDGAPQRAEREVAHVDSIDAHRAALNVIETRQEESDGGLAGSRGAHQRHGLTRRATQREARQDGFGPLVSVGDVVELDVAAHRGEVDRVGFLHHDRVGVEQLQDPFRAGAGLLGDGEHSGEHPHRGDELYEVGREGEKRAQGDTAVERHPSAEREHADLRQRRDDLERGRKPGLNANRSDARPVERLGSFGDAGELA